VVIVKEGPGLGAGAGTFPVRQTRIVIVEVIPVRGRTVKRGLA